MLRNLRHYFLPIIIILLGLILSRPLWATGSVLDTHDGIYHAVRMSELWEMLKAGQFPVRYATNLDNHFGIPLFNYVYPLPYYLGLPIVALGFSPFWAVKLVTVGAYLLGAIGIYLLVPSATGLIGSILYLTSPYLLLNMLVRGALGETLAISLLPYVILAGNNIARGRLRWYHPLPYALLFLSHHILGFLFLPVYLLIIPRSRKVLYSLFLSLGLASWYLLPAILESGLVQSVANANFTFNYSDHFVAPLQLIWSNWGFGFSVKGTGDGMTFQLGIIQLSVFIFSSLLALKAKRYLLSGIILISLFFTTNLSSFIWQLIPPLQLVQFPWRLLFLPTFLIPYLYLKFPPPLKLGILMCVISFLFALFWAKPRYPQNEAQYMQQWYSNRYGTTTSARSELLPKWVSGAPDPAGVPLNYFPLWQAKDEAGRTVPLFSSPSGQIEYDREVFTGPIHYYLRQTWFERVANLITIIVFISLWWL